MKCASRLSLVPASAFIASYSIVMTILAGRLEARPHPRSVENQFPIYLYASFTQSVAQNRYCDRMKNHITLFLSLVLGALPFHGLAEPALPEPGPEMGGLRLRLVVTPHSEGGKEGYDIQVAFINVRAEAIQLRAQQWRARRYEGGFREFLEAAVSIESYPAIAPWLGQVQGSSQGAVEPEYELKPGETLSVQWHTTGRHLKNTVSNPLEVQNPEFTESGLYSVHANLGLVVAGRSVRLRSNEQLVPMGGSRETPKHTYGPVFWADENSKTATLGLGSMHKVSTGDRFIIHTGNIGMTWTLTLTQVEPDHSIGTLEPSRTNPSPVFPSRGSYAALVPKR